MSTAGYKVNIPAGPNDTTLFTANDYNVEGGANPPSPTHLEGCNRIWVGCNPSSAVTLLVNVPTLHQPGFYVPIYPGGNLEFTNRSQRGILDVLAHGDGGVAIADWGVTERNV